MSTELRTQVPFAGMQDTASELLERLAELTPLKTWVLAEVKNDHWIIRGCTDASFGLKVDQFLSWHESVCRSMIVMGGPQFAPDLQKVEHLAQSAVATRLGIASYLGVPIRIPGKVEGMLCGLDNRVIEDKLDHLLPLVETFGRVLAGSWAQHLAEVQPHPADPHILQNVQTLTGLYDLGTFRDLLQAAADHRHRNEPGGVLLFDVGASNSGNGAESEQDVAAAIALLKQATRPQDSLAHLARGEFALFLPGTSEAGLVSVARRIQSSLNAEGFSARWGASWFKEMQQLNNIDQLIKAGSLPGASLAGSDEHTIPAAVPAGPG
ncbi:GGDEF domain-containing protein [Xanthomonas campestris]|uniref:GGDEF domain-containing protein n=1 Tax=Xanthomonas TaxID=338 RepID=UPI0011B010C2|nr:MULTISPECIES: GAF domain-containing protein [Xanthomonas]MBB5736966.1 GGDEF domain-containing protein [Xanthomonas sp. CFBP 8152]NIJ77819.1 GGDEF domain-containing protein [Xanthomonas sp. CFBP 8151]